MNPAPAPASSPRGCTLLRNVLDSPGALLALWAIAVGAPLWLWHEASATPPPAWPIWVLGLTSSVATAAFALARRGWRRTRCELEQVRDELRQTRADLELRALARTAELTQLSARFQTLLTLASDGLHLIDEQGRLHEYSESFRRMHGYAEHEMPGLTVADWQAQLTGADLAENIHRHLGESAVFETLHRRKDGTVFPVEISYRGLTLDGRNFLYASARDITERHRAADRVRLQHIASAAASSSVVVTNTDGVIQWVNEAFTRVTGYSATEAIGRKPSVLKSGRHPPEIYARLWATITRGEIWHGKLHNRRKDGSLYEEEITISPVKDAGGTTTHFIAIKTELTQLDRGDAAAFEAQVQLATALDLAHLAYWKLDLATETFTFNDRFFALHGTSATHEGGYLMAVDTYARQFLPPAHRHRAQQWLVRIRAPGATSYESENLFQRRDGEIRHSLVRVAIIKDTSGRIVSCTGANQDITDLRRAEFGLRQSEERFRTLVTAMGEGLVLQDATGAIVESNPQAERILGLDHGQMLGRVSMDPRWRTVRVDGSPLPGEEHPAMITLRTGQRSTNVVFGVHRADGELRWINVNAEPIMRSGEARPVAVVATFADVTERLLEQKKRQELLAQIERDAHIKGELLREVNHRVTNNLTSVLGLLAFEAENLVGDSPPLAPVLARLSTRLRGLLDVHRLLARSGWAPVPVDHLAGQVIHAALGAAAWPRPPTVTIPASALTISPRHASSVALVLSELTTNTAKYAGPGNAPVAITFTAEPTADGALLRYRDSGPGYPPDVVAGQRSNVGLKLIREIVATTLRGSVELTNDHGAVTTIRMRSEADSRT